MPIDPKEFLNYIGIPEDVESLDEAKEKFNSAFIKKDMQAIKDEKELYGKVVGAYNESNKTLFKRTAKELGIDLSGEDLDKMHIGQIIETVVPKTFKGFIDQINTLKESSGKGVNEKIQAVQAEFEKFKNDHKEKIEGYDKIKGEFDNFRTAKDKELNDYKVSQKKNEKYGSFKWGAGATPLKKTGFINHVESKYVPVLDESGELIPVDKQGNKIPNPAKAGAYKTWEDVLVDEAVELNKAGEQIYAVASNQNQLPRPVTTKTFSANENQNQNQAPLRKVNTGTRSKVA